MSLPYENPKWEKLRKEISQIGFRFEDIPSMDSYVKRLRKSAMQKKDYAIILRPSLLDIIARVGVVI